MKTCTIVPRGMSKWSASFQLKRSKFNITGRQDLKNFHIFDIRVYLQMEARRPRSSAGDSGADCKLGLTIVSPNLLSVPETLGSWTAGRISCRLSALTSFLAYRCLLCFFYKICEGALLLKISIFIFSVFHFILNCSIPILIVSDLTFVANFISLVRTLT